MRSVGGELTPDCSGVRLSDGGLGFPECRDLDTTVQCSTAVCPLQCSPACRPLQSTVSSPANKSIIYDCDVDRI